MILKNRNSQNRCFESSFFFGPSGGIRTHGLDIPNVAPYQLGYTRILNFEFSRLWSGMWSNLRLTAFLTEGDLRFCLGPCGVFAAGVGLRGGDVTCSQTRRDTNFATPGYHSMPPTAASFIIRKSGGDCKDFLPVLQYPHLRILQRICRLFSPASPETEKDGKLYHTACADVLQNETTGE